MPASDSVVVTAKGAAKFDAAAVAAMIGTRR